MKYYIYAYRTPIDVEINSMSTIIPQGKYFYIGKGQGKRKYDHLTEKFDKVVNHLKHGVILKIYQEKEMPVIDILEESNNEDYILTREVFYIKKYGKLIDNLGFLTNLTDGGQGTSGHTHSDELKQHWSKIRKGRTPPNKGVKRPGIGGRPKGIPWSIETREKIMKIRSSEGYYDYCQSDKRRKKISESKKGCKGSALGKSWFNNGSLETYQLECPEGFSKGRLKKQSNGKKGLLWYTNGTDSRQFKENNQPEGWKRGRITKK
jgi:hypothetical protein